MVSLRKKSTSVGPQKVRKTSASDRRSLTPADAKPQVRAFLARFVAVNGTQGRSPAYRPTRPPHQEGCLTKGIRPPRMSLRAVVRRWLAVALLRTGCGLAVHCYPFCGRWRVMSADQERLPG